MENIISTNQNIASVSTVNSLKSQQSFSLLNYFGTSWEQLQFNYYSVIVVTLILGSCLGSIAAMFILQNGAVIWQLALCIMISMFNNVAAIGHLPVKWVIYSCLLSVLINGSLILVNL